ncbi:MAG: heparan-alpha-glucosaminide N-acetyltransferase domain-containing protein [Promethearchaeota archaeon]
MPHYFSFVLRGTIIGEVIFDVFRIENKKERNLSFLSIKVQFGRLSSGLAKRLEKVKIHKKYGILINRKMQRFKSIDIFRGMCMSWMFLTHLIDWWFSGGDWLQTGTVGIIDPIWASGFLFISGVSVALSYRNRM